MRAFLSLLGVVVVGFAACGGEVSECPGDGCDCTGSSTCTCLPGNECTWKGSEETGCNEDGSSCSLECLDDNVCTGTCGASCSIDCKGDSSCDLTTGPSGSVSCEDSECDVTVGESGSISCSGGATCHVRCTATCSVSCSESTCDLRCPGDAAPRRVEGSGGCG